MKPGWFTTTPMVCCTLFLLGPSSASAQFADDREAEELVSSSSAASFVREQLQFSRVREARENSEARIKRIFRERGIRYPAAEAYVRVFKRERTLELWVRSENEHQFELLKAYRICALAGRLGPKRRQGDRQVPEGFYNIDMFNPSSTYHLSMRIDYPNQRDIYAKARGQKLGGDIFIHGGCRSEGCLAITDEGINEVYLVGLMARASGQERIPVHIFPARFGASWDSRNAARLRHADPSVMKFWKTLKPAYYYFERHHRIPAVGMDKQGHYRLVQSLFAER